MRKESKKMILTKYNEIINAIDKNESFYMELAYLEPPISKDIFKYIALKLGNDSKIIKINKTLYKIER